MAVGNKTGGRIKGTPNKLGTTAKENIAAVFVRLGGTAAMAKWAEENQTAYYSIYSKLLPHEITGDAENPVHLVIAPNLDKIRDVIGKIAD